MIVSTDQLKDLRTGSVLTIVVPDRRPHDGAPKAKPPCIVGREYGAQLAPFEKSKLRIIVIGMAAHPDGWQVMVRSGSVEHPRFLKARPGGDEGDYVTDPARGLPSEPEAVDELTLQRQTRTSHLHRTIGYGRAADLEEEVRILTDSIVRLRGYAEMGRAAHGNVRTLMRARDALVRTLKGMAA